MVDAHWRQSRQGGPPHTEAERLLAEGIPLGLTAAAAAAYSRRCGELADEIDDNTSLLSIMLRAAALIAPSALRSVQSELDAAIAAADDLALNARECESELAGAYALAAWGMTHPGPEHTAQRAAAGEDILDIAVRYHDDRLIPIGYALLLTAFLERGEIRSLDTQLLEHRTDHPAMRSKPYANPAVWFRCLRLILDGDVAQAERQAEQLLEHSPRDGTVARALYTTQIGMIRWMQGRFDGIEEDFLTARREYPEQLLWPASLAWLWLRQGRTAASEALLKTLPPPSQIPRDRYWLSTVTVLAEIATVTGSEDEARELRNLLVPFASHLVPVGIGVTFWGTVARTLGLLEERLGQLDEARAHLELAIETSAHVGALAWHAEAQIELATFALRHNISEVPAYDLLAQAHATAVARGFPALAQRAMHMPRIRVLGGFEVISLCGTKAEWTSRKARELLKMLVAARSVPMSREVLMDALWPGEDPAALSNRFSVAVNVIRRALDPQRMRPTQQHVVTEGESIRLDSAQVDIDLERFLLLAQRGDEPSRRAARELYRGDAFAEEPYADWAIEVRDLAAYARRMLD